MRACSRPTNSSRVSLGDAKLLVAIGGLGRMDSRGPLTSIVRFSSFPARAASGKASRIPTGTNSKLLMFMLPPSLLHRRARGVFSAEDGFVEAAGEVVPVSEIFGEQFSQAKVVVGQLRVVGARKLNEAPHVADLFLIDFTDASLLEAGELLEGQDRRCFRVLLCVLFRRRHLANRDGHALHVDGWFGELPGHGGCGCRD